jgi:predicted nucleotidyltransferase
MDQLEFFRHIIRILHGSGLRYMVVGSFASGFWGEPRATYDVDVVISLNASDVPRLAALFPSDTFYYSPEAAQDAIRRRTQFNVIHPESGNKIDLMIQGADAWGELQLSRRRLLSFEPGLEVYVGAPEDIILSKLLYYREGGSEKHLRDIAGIIKLRKSELDGAYLDHWSAELSVGQEWITAQSWKI